MPANTQPLSRSHFSDLDRRDTQPGMKFNFRSPAYTHKRDMHDQKTKQPPDDTSPMHRSPIRFPPLRIAGQSVGEEITRLADQFNDRLVALVVFLVLTLWEWFRWWFSLPPNPWPITVITIFVLAFTGLTIRRHRTAIANLKQGLAGERTVG